MKKITFPEHHLFQLLRQYDHCQLPLDLFVSRYFREHKALGSKDRQFIAQSVYMMVRWRSLLDYLARGYSSWEKRYAQLQTLEPQQHIKDETIPLAIRLSLPEPLLDALIADYGKERAIQLGVELNGEAPITVRVNPLKSSRCALLQQWKEHIDAEPCRLSCYGIQLKKRIPLTSLAEFKEGLFEIQDEASQLAALLVQAKPGDQVLDYCAGAGGKTLAFAPLMHNKGQIYLHDVRPFALAQAKKRLKRASIQNAQFLPPNHKKLAQLKGKMDWILLDVPCSGTGTYRRNPDQKWNFSQTLLKRLTEEQKEIFEKALPYLKPGGKIVYATCSILEAENQNQIEYFTHHYPVKLDAPPFLSLPSPGSMDGFFAATLTHVCGADGTAAKKAG